MKAIIIGATGATGKDLLNQLLKDNYFNEVEIFVRRDIPKASKKLNINIIDFEQTDQWKNLVKGDVLFSCLGTTLKAAGSKNKMWQIDYEYQYKFAKAAKENGIETYVLVSADFSSPKSPFFYAKLKGQLEDAVIKLGFERTIILQPPLLVRENSRRRAEVIQEKILRFLNSLGILKSQKPLPTEKLAEAMLITTKNLDNGIHRVKPHVIWQYLIA